MPEPVILYSVALLLSALLAALMAGYCLRGPRVPQVITFMSLLVAGAVYSLGYAMEILSPSQDAMLFWNTFQYLGIPFVPAMWLLLAIQYTGKGHTLSLRLRLLLFLVPVLTLLFRFTDSYLHLHYADVSMMRTDGFSVIQIQKGPWYLVSLAYINLALMLASAFYLTLLLEPQGRRRRQAGAMLVGSLFPWGGFLVYGSGNAPYGLDLTPLGMTISNVVILFSMFRYRLLDLIPVSREKVFEKVVDGVVVLDEGYRIVDFNPSAAMILPELGKSPLGTECSQLFGLRKGLLAAIATGEEADIQTEVDGSTRYHEVRVVDLFDGDHAIIGRVVLLSDITERVDTMQHLQLMASTDDLTGVSNRRHFLDRCQLEWDRARRHSECLSLMMLDIDCFKEINDRHGHQAGDAMLKMVADVCRANIRSIDILGRYGGDEFVVLLPKTDSAAALVVAERLRSVIERAEKRLNDGCLRVTASFGIAAETPAERETIDHLLGRADQGLYRAKMEGRNCVRMLLEEGGPRRPEALATEDIARDLGASLPSGNQYQQLGDR